MNVTRRGFFGMLAALAACPLFGQRGGVSYRYEFKTSIPPKTTLRIRKWEPNTVCESGKMTGSCEPLIFRCGSGDRGTIWWSKEGE